MKTRVLILCTGNSCRSQMAEGILRHYSESDWDVQSAGTKPSNVNPIAVRVMEEIGIDISGHRSKHVKEFLGQHFHYVITVCDNADRSCPVFTGNSIRLHWPFPDPPHGQTADERTVDEFRKVRNMIHDKFRDFANRKLKI